MFKCLIISFLLESLTIVCYISVSDGNTFRVQRDLRETHSAISNIIDINEIGKGHTSESHQRIVLFSHT